MLTQDVNFLLTNDKV